MRYLQDNQYQDIPLTKIPDINEEHPHFKHIKWTDIAILGILFSNDANVSLI